MKIYSQYLLALALLPLAAFGNELRVPVRSGKIIRATLHGYETAFGSIQPAPSAGRLVIAAARDGVLVRIAIRPGQRVEKDELLFRLDDRVARRKVEEREQALAFAKKVFTRQKELIEIDGTSEREYQQAARDFHLAEQALATAQVQLGFCSIRAPAAGTVASVSATAGQVLLAAQPLAVLLDPRRREVSIQVPVAAMKRVRAGQPVQVRGELGGWREAGTIGYLAESVDPENGAVEVRVPLAADFPWRVGRFVQARILVETHAEILAVPVEALVTDFGGQTYIVLLQGNQASRLPVVGKLREDGWIEIEGKGLREGIEIVTEGAYGLPGQTRVEVVEP